MSLSIDQINGDKRTVMLKIDGGVQQDAVGGEYFAKTGWDVIRLTGAQALVAELSSVQMPWRINHGKLGAHCAVIFCTPGGATAIIIARMRVIEKITLPTERPHYADDGGIGKWLGVKRSKLEAGRPHL